MAFTETVVAVVDDDENVRDSVDALLRSRGTRCRTFGTGSDFLAVSDLRSFACVLLDVVMGETNGFDVLRAYRRRGGTAPVLMLTAQRDLGSAVRAMRMGASDFLVKPYDPEELVGRVRSALDQQRGLLSQDEPDKAAGVMERVERLTEREREVFGHLVDGHSAKAIALMLNISPRTVEIHRARVIEKMGARNLAELLRIGVGLPERAFVYRGAVPSAAFHRCG